MDAGLMLMVGAVLVLAWVNGANDVSKGIATLLGSGTASARRALFWGTGCTVLGGLAALSWGMALTKVFGSGFLSPGYPITNGFLAGTLIGACTWVALATRLGLPVSTTHALLGGLVGAGLEKIGAEGLQAAAIAHKALLPLLGSPLLAILLCGSVLGLARILARRLPPWRPGCCAKEDWRRNPLICARDTPSPWMIRLTRLWVALHWLSGGATSFARGLNDVPKIAACLTLAFPLLGNGSGLSEAQAVTASVVAVTLAMGLGSLWGSSRVLDVLAHKVVSLDPRTGLVANLGTAALVLAASPLGLPVSTTHVSTGSLLGVRLVDKSVPVQGDALYRILLAWIVTLPCAGVVAAAAGSLLS